MSGRVARMAQDPSLEPAEGTIDHYWWLWGGEAWQQWCERAAPTSRGLQL